MRIALNRESHDQTVRNDLLHQLESAGCDTAAQHYFKQEEDRSLQSVPPPSANPVLIDPLDKLCDIASTRDVTVDDLVEALKLTAEEVELIQAMSIGQRHNPLWLDARQWRITSSNFGRVCNRTFRHLYPPSLVKSVLGNYGMLRTLLSVNPRGWSNSSQPQPQT